MRVLIVGASSQGKVACDAIRAAASSDSVAGFVDDAAAMQGTRFAGLPVVGTVASAAEQADDDTAFFVAIGANTARCRVADLLRAHGRRLATVVHPTARVLGGVSLGDNVLVCAGAIVGVETVVERDAVINTAASIDHESVIRRGAYVAPGVCSAGQVDVGEQAFIGLGALLGPRTRVGQGTVVAAGSLVLADLPDGVMARGRPATVVGPLPDPVDWRRILTGRKAD